MAKKKHEKHDDETELTPAEMGVSETESQESISQGEWVCVRNISASGVSYKAGDAFPADQVTKQLVASGAIGKA